MESFGNCGIAISLRQRRVNSTEASGTLCIVRGNVYQFTILSRSIPSSGLRPKRRKILEVKEKVVIKPFDVTELLIASVVRKFFPKSEALNTGRAQD